MALDKYRGIVPAEAYHPRGQRKRFFKGSKLCEDLSVAMLRSCSCVVFCGGNNHAAPLESFHKAQDLILQELRLLVQSMECRSQGVWRISGVYSRSQDVALALELHRVRRVSLWTSRGSHLFFLPALSCGAGYLAATTMEQNINHIYTPPHSWMVWLSEHTFVMFLGSAQPTYWNSEHIGWIQRICEPGVWAWQAQGPSSADMDSVQIAKKRKMHCSHSHSRLHCLVCLS